MTTSSTIGTPPKPSRSVIVPMAAIIAVGIAVRIVFFLQPRSLWLDEAMIALNFRESLSFLLFSELFYFQRAPVGWLALQKAIFEIFGHSAIALRLPALLAGTAALVLICDTARRMLPMLPALTVAAIAAMAPLPVYYCAEVKHYAFDLLATSLLLWLLALQVGRPITTRFLVAFNAAAIVLALFSLPYAIVALAVILALAPHESPRPLKLMAALLAWIPVFIISALWTITRYGAELRRDLQGFWAEGFWFQAPTTLDAVFWPFTWILDLFSFFQFTPINIVAAGAFYAGIALSIRERKTLGMACSVAILLALAASAFEFYPPIGRLALFLLPPMLLLMGYGLWELELSYRRGRRIAEVCATLLVAFVIIHSVTTYRAGAIETGPSTSPPILTEDIRQGVRIARENSPAGARFLIPRFTTPAYAFHHAHDMIPPDQVWLERVPPFTARGDVSNNQQFIIWHEESRFSDRDADGRWQLSDMMLEVLDQAHEEQSTLVLVVTHRHEEFIDLAAEIARHTQPPRRIPFPGGLVFIFPPR